MSDQPKPTGEWPEGSPVTPWDMSSRDMLMHLSPYHNAALAAEREERAIIERSSDAWQHQVAGLAQQLASEREKFQKAKEWDRITEIEVNNLRSLLNEIDPDISRKTIAELRQQLSASVECLEWLREELKNDEYFVEKIDIAFAKVKEGK